jgi:hypothetical protein
MLQGVPVDSWCYRESLRSSRQCVDVGLMAKLAPSRQPGAGVSADTKFSELRDAWFRRAVRPYRWIFLLVGSAIFVAEVLLGSSALDWTLGVALGGTCTMWMFIRDSPPGWIENWRTGADGERRTAKALRALDNSTWRVLHDLPLGRANRDHVLVGPAGVFLIDTKAFPGSSVRIEGDDVAVERLDDPDRCDRRQIARQVRRDAARLRDELTAAMGRSPGWVQGVVVVWGVFAQRIVEGDRVVFVHGDELVAWLEAQSGSLSPERRGQIVTALEATRR